MFYWTDYFLLLYREENICKMVSLQWKDRATLRELAQHLLSETTTDEVMVSLYFRAIKFLLSKVNQSMYTLNSTPILPYRSFLLIPSFGTFLFLQHLQSIPPFLHTPLSLPTRVLATQSINSHLKDQRPQIRPSNVPVCCCCSSIPHLFPFWPLQTSWKSGTAEWYRAKHNQRQWWGGRSWICYSTNTVTVTLICNKLKCPSRSMLRGIIWSLPPDPTIRTFSLYLVVRISSCNFSITWSFHFTW